MHKIRAQAKQNAWYSSSDDVNAPIRNPFAKYRANTPSRSNTQGDEEGKPGASGLRPVLSHSATQQASQVATGSKPGLIHHAATAPGATSLSTRQRTYDDVEIPQVASSPSQSTVWEKIQHDSGDGDHDYSTALKPDSPSKLGELEVPDSSEAGVRKRRGLLGRLSWSTDEKKRKFTVVGQLRSTIFNSWLNVLLVFIPAGFVVYYLHLRATTVFAINFLAIVPSIMMVSLAVEEIGLRTGDLIGALLNMSFSNAPQLISSILLLRSRQITVLKTSLLGSIISNLLLMLGLCMFFGGINRIEQHYNLTVAQTISMMLLLATLSLVIPTASHLMANVTQHDIVVQSRGTSVVIIFSYGLYLFFQLKTHISMFTEPSAKTPKRDLGKLKNAVVPERYRTRSKIVIPPASIMIPPPSIAEEEEPEDEFDEPQLSMLVAVSVLTVFTVLIGFNAEFATSSIQSMVRQSKNLTQTFVGFVILPLLSNDPTSIVNAVKDKMNLCIALTLERCMQTALLVVPLIVIIAWAMGVEEMTLEFDGFSVAATFVSIIIVTYMIQDGKSNWLVGALSIKVYVIVALAAYFIRV